MQDFWLTRDLLQTAGATYWLLVMLALATVLWLAPGILAKVVGTAVVLALASVLPWHAKEERQQVQQNVDEFRVRQAKAKAVFDERCKTAGEVVLKTIDNTEAVFLPRVRQRSGQEGDPMATEAAAWNENYPGSVTSPA